MLIALALGRAVFHGGDADGLGAGLGGVAALGLVVAYSAIPHVARRIKRFLDPASGDTFRVDTGELNRS